MSLSRYIKALLFCVTIVMPTVTRAETTLTLLVGGSTFEYDVEQLLAMPQTTIVTDNDYVDGPTSFTGPLLRDMLSLHGIESDQTLNMTALNDFSVQVPAEDAYTYDVILALKQDGRPMSIREKGPIWVIYPMSDNQELQDEMYNSRLIWQLASIEMQ